MNFQVSSTYTGLTVPRFDESYERYPLPPCLNYIQKINNDQNMRVFLERVHAFLIEYLNSVSTDDIAFRDNFSLLERRLIKRYKTHFFNIDTY